MNEDANSQEQKSELRRRAEMILRTQGLRQVKPPAPGEMAEGELLDLIHEIQVHQIELEMQNEELRQTQAELAAARDRYFGLFDLAPVGYFMINEDASIVEVNLAGADLLGVRRSELNGKTLPHFIHERDRDRFFLQYHQVYRTRQREQGELRFVKPGGDLWYAHITFALVKEPEEDAGFLRIILQDVTERVVSERNLKTYSTQLEGLIRDLESFNYIASHDLQEPLRKILQFGEFVKKNASVHADEQLADYVERMQGAAMRMQTLIADLLEFSQVNNRHPDFEPTDLNKVVQEVLDILELQIQSSGAQIAVGDLPRISADLTQMQQLFQNLIGNSLKFHEPDQPPVVTIESRETSPGQVEIWITDEGIGFDELDLEKIFRPFERLTSRNQYEGSGIGLAICQKIVEQHAGSITARSKPGEGATFIVTLPVQQS